jgi:hypothetical protein
MRTFISKKEVFEYIKTTFSQGNTLILINGSTAKKPAKKFSDFDIEVWGPVLKKPYYELAFINEKPILISIYFYVFKEGKTCKPPSAVKILFGKYNASIKSDFSDDAYTVQEKERRECQLVTDFLFKYMRSGDKKYLESVQKRINTL